MAAARHAGVVRVTHWLTVLAAASLLLSGVQLVLSHPRFYWGESGNVNITPLFSLPVPSSRGTVPTGFDYVLADQNGWSRYLHFQAAWLVIMTGLVYVCSGVRRGHFRKTLGLRRDDRTWTALRASIGAHLRFRWSALGDPWSYNPLQRLSYLAVVFGLFPLAIWTGLAMAPAFTAVFPWAVTLLGGRQSARTLHFAVTIALVFFTLVHVLMICLAGFRTRMRAMITGQGETRP